MLLLLFPVLLLALLAAFYLPIKRLYIAHNPARTPPVLPTTASTTALHQTPPPPSSLRGRGRGRARSKGRLFGFGIGDRLGLGLGRRAKSLGGPVLPRFASNGHGHAAYTPLASAPASPSLSASASLHPPSPYLAAFPADPTAVPLVDLGASWGTISSISHVSSSSSHVHAGQLVDVSHADDNGEYALVDVSVPPSPAAWARAHPPLKPTPTSSFPASPAAPTFPPSLNDGKRTGDALTHLPSPPLSPTFPVPSPATARPGSALVGLALTSVASSPPAAVSSKAAQSPPLASKAELDSVVSKDVLEAPLLLPVSTAGAADDEFRPAIDVDPADHDFRAVDEEPAQRSPVATTKPTALPLHIDLPPPPVFASAEQELGDEGEEVGREGEEAGELPSAHAIDALLAGVRALHPPAAASPGRTARSPVAPSPAASSSPSAEPSGESPVTDAPASADTPAPLAVHEGVEVVEVEEVNEEEVEDVKEGEAHDELVDVADVAEEQVEVEPASAPRLLFPRTRAHSAPSSASTTSSDLHVDDDAEEDGAWAGEVHPHEVRESEHGQDGMGGREGDEEAHAALVAWVDGLPALARRAPMEVVDEVDEGEGEEQAEVVEAEEEGEVEDDAVDASALRLSVDVDVEQVDANVEVEEVEDVFAEADVDAVEVDAFPLSPSPPCRAVEQAVDEVAVVVGADAADGEQVDDALPVSPAPTVGGAVMDADEQADAAVDDVDVAQAEAEDVLPASPSPTRGILTVDADADDPADLPLPSTTPVRARFDFGSADVEGVEEEADPGELELPAMPMPLARQFEQEGVPVPDARPFLDVHAPAPVLALNVDEDIEEQDLASPVSSSSLARSPKSPNLPSSSPSSTSSDLDDEEDIGASPRALALVLRPRATPAWSRRAAAAPALGLPSSTLHLSSAVSSSVKEREWDLREWEAGWVPGAFPSAASTPSHISSTTNADAEDDAKDGNAQANDSGKQIAKTKTKPELRPRRSPLDAALAMQLRPGLGLGADGAWLVRFLMSFFGWLGVLVAGNGERR